jgi:hypothetical protein
MVDGFHESVSLPVILRRPRERPSKDSAEARWLSSFEARALPLAPQDDELPSMDCRFNSGNHELWLVMPALVAGISLGRAIALPI